MDWRNQQTNIYTNNTRRSVSVRGDLQRTRFTKSHDYPENDRDNQRNRHNKCLPAIALCLLNLATAPATLAETVGGVSATAAPVPISLSSVTNQKHSGFTRSIYYQYLWRRRSVSRCDYECHAVCYWCHISTETI